MWKTVQNEAPLLLFLVPLSPFWHPHGSSILEPLVVPLSLSNFKDTSICAEKECPEIFAAGRWDFFIAFLANSYDYFRHFTFGFS